MPAVSACGTALDVQRRAVSCAPDRIHRRPARRAQGILRNQTNFREQNDAAGAVAELLRKGAPGKTFQASLARFSALAAKSIYIGRGRYAVPEE
jgi:hypothetical protein